MQTKLARRVNNIIKEMQDGLDPKVLASWYLIVQSRARELCSEHLKGKIKIEQDPILYMKFRLNISKRTVPFVISAIEQTLPEMPYSTRLYFEKVQEIILEEFTKAKATPQ
ncbi:MAG: hypothetical protein ACE5J2_03695 [Nitrososphaerales archaeon]